MSYNKKAKTNAQISSQSIAEEGKFAPANADCLYFEEKITTRRDMERVMVCVVEVTNTDKGPAFGDFCTSQ